MQHDCIRRARGVHPPRRVRHLLRARNPGREAHREGHVAEEGRAIRGRDEGGHHHLVAAQCGAAVSVLSTVRGLHVAGSAGQILLATSWDTM